MEIQPAQSFPDVSNFMVQTYMDEQNAEVEQNQKIQPQNGMDIVTAVQNLDSKIVDFSSSFSDRLTILTNSVAAVLENSKQTLSQISNVLEQQKSETRSRESILEQKFLLAEEKETNVDVEKSLDKMSEFLDALSLDIGKIRPEDTDSFLNTVKGMPKWVIGTLIAIGVVTAAQLGLSVEDTGGSFGGGGSSGDIESLPAGVGNGGDLSAPGDPKANVINKNLATNYGEYKKVGGSISWRNNNPGNIMYGDFSKKKGAIGYTVAKDGVKTAVFSSMTAGEQARKDLLFSPNNMYYNRDISFLADKYATADPKIYIEAITKALGVPASTKLSELTEAQRNQLLATMKKQEGFTGGVVFLTEGKMGTEAPGDGKDKSKINKTFTDLADKYGATITSLERSPEDNKRVGGKPNSYHLRGMAGDFVVPNKSKKGFMQEAKSMGLDAVDEGDHIHLEPAPGSSWLNEKKQDSGQKLLSSTQDVKKGKMQNTTNMVNMVNGSTQKQQKAHSANKPDLIPAINLRNSMVA